MIDFLIFSVVIYLFVTMIMLGYMCGELDLTFRYSLGYAFMWPINFLIFLVKSSYKSLKYTLYE